MGAESVLRDLEQHSTSHQVLRSFFSTHGGPARWLLDQETENKGEAGGPSGHSGRVDGLGASPPGTESDGRKQERPRGSPEEEARGRI